MSKGREEMIAEGVDVLAQWLRFLDEKDRELQEKLRRLREQTVGDRSPDEGGPTDKSPLFDWMDDTPPPVAPSDEGEAPPPAQARAEEPVSRDREAGDASESEVDDELPEWLRD